MTKVTAVANSSTQRANEIADTKRKEPELKQNLHGVASAKDSFERYDPSSIRSQLNEYSQGNLKTKKSNDSIERNGQSRLGEQRCPEGSEEQRKAEEEQKAMIEATMEGIRKSEEEREHAEMKTGVSKDSNDQHKSQLGEQRYPEGSQEQRKVEEEQKAIMERIRKSEEEREHAEMKTGVSKDSNDQHKSRLGERRSPEQQRNAEKDEKGKK